MIKCNADKIYEKMTTEKKGSVWTLDYIYTFFSGQLKIGANDLKNKYYLEFYKIISELVEKEYIKSFGREKTSVQPPLYRKYKVLKEVKSMDSDDSFKALSLNKLDLKYYKHRADEFKKDYPTLVILNELMRNTDKYTELSLNELSYELFGYEKAMGEPEYDVYKIMKKISLKENSINCRQKNEPLLNTIYKGFYQKSVRNILIVENLETYWSLNKFFRKISTNIDMLVFGKGYDITKNFAGIVQYGVTTEDNILYYGDIDLSGIDIFNVFKRNFSEYNITPATNLYKLLLKSGLDKGIKKSVSQNQRFIEDSDLALFLSFFDKETGEEIYRIITDRTYIPQESLNYIKIKNVGGDLE